MESILDFGIRQELRLMESMKKEWRMELGSFKVEEEVYVIGELTQIK